jgi:LysR family glycine cleavage system transcriptional activator
MRRQLNGQMYVWLHVFACAARHLSFTRCAEELHITPGAVSQQMRQLEERLGYRLFPRARRRAEAEGQRLARPWPRPTAASRPSCCAWMPGDPRHLARAFDPVVPGQMADAAPAALQQRYPDIELRLVAEDSNQALHPGDFDLAIDLNDGSYPGMLSTPLLDEQIFPVCSPAAARRRCTGRRTWCTIRCCTTSPPGAAVRNMPNGSST